MTQDEIQRTLVVLLDALKQASTTAMRTQEALLECNIPGYQKALQKITEREQQIVDKQRESLGQNTVEHSSIELASALAKMMVKV